VDGRLCFVVAVVVGLWGGRGGGSWVCEQVQMEAILSTDGGRFSRWVSGDQDEGCGYIVGHMGYRVEGFNSGTVDMMEDLGYSVMQR
jgi:hypothetical protein